ncbi:MAG: methyltransferase domain-containing protein [Candidatus Aenigmarchaeota archaeon]|nr:methyltransferase domain-containing protein [Candidatus Aenigmarchaeota archaeon]
MYLALLSGKNIEMAKEEVLSFSSDSKEKLLDGRVFLFDTKKTPDFSKLGLAHEAGVFLGKKPEEVDFSVFSDKNIKISVLNLESKENSLLFSKKIGEFVSKKGFKVDFKSLEILRIYLTDAGAYFTKQVFVQDKKYFSKRASPKRDFFMPTSIDPMVARALVNIAGAKKGATVLDPFCGSGGLLLEAAAVGAEVYGCDIEEKCVEGTIGNLEQFGYLVTAVTSDALDAKKVFKKKYDCVVTDLPFGKSSKILQEKKKLYNEFLAEVPGLVKKGGRVVVGCDEAKLVYPKECLLLEARFSLYIHRSMTRYFFVFKAVP